MASLELPKPSDAVWNDYGVALTLIREMLDTKGFQKVAQALVSDEYSSILCDLCMDLVAMVGPYLDSPDVVQLLERMVEICSAKEINISLLEVLEGKKRIEDQLKLLPLLSQVISKVWSSKVWRTTTTTVQTVLRHVGDSLLMTEHMRGFKKKTLLTPKESDYIVKTTEFLESVSTIVSVKENQLDSQKAAEWYKLREICTEGLVLLMGPPLSASATFSDDKSEHQLTKDGENATKIMGLLSLMNCKYYMLLERDKFLHKHKQQQQQQQQEENKAGKGRNHSIGIACIAYLWVGEEVQWSMCPSPLRLEYIVQLCVHSVEVLLREYETSEVYISKGLILLQKCVSMVSPECFGMDDLVESCCTDLLESLTTIAIYCQEEQLRKQSVPLFRKVMQLFTADVRHRIYRYLFHHSDHAGVWGLLIHDLKDEVHRAIKENLEDSPFVGDRLNPLLYVALSLPKFEDRTSVLRDSDRLMGAVNFLVYLLLADRLPRKKTSVWADLEHWNHSFCKPLLKAVDSSKDEHQRIFDGVLNEEKEPQLNKFRDQPEMAVEIAGEFFQDIPDVNSKEALAESLLQLDVLQDGVQRVVDIILSSSSSQDN